MTRTQRSARPPPAVRGSAGDHASQEKEGGRWALPPPRPGRTREPGIPPSSQLKRAQRRAAPRAAPRNCGAARTGRTPSYRGRSRTYVSSRSMQIDTWFFEAGLLLWPQRFPSLSQVPAPVDAEVRRWDTRSTQGLRLRRESSPGCHSRARRSPYPSRRAPPHSLSCPIVGLRQRRSRELGE
jgi:hypothetical protein